VTRAAGATVGEGRLDAHGDEDGHHGQPCDRQRGNDDQQHTLLRVGTGADATASVKRRVLLVTRGTRMFGR
jgi:hypothetical protein